MISAFTIAGWGAYRPRQVLLSSELDARHGNPAGWHQREFGIASRHLAAPDETSSMMAAEAARVALARAGWAEGDFDAIIGGCGVMEQPIPSTAVLVQDRLGLGKSGVVAFDVNQTCLSFMAALDVAGMGIATGRWRRVLVFAADIASCGLDPENAKIRAIFGDGAAALAIEACEGERGIAGMQSVTHGAHHGLAQLRAGGTRLRVEEGYAALVAGSHFEMDAFGIFKAAARVLPGVIDAALAQAGIGRDELACVVCHQASAPGVEHVKRLFAPGGQRVVDLFASHGNQIAASIPTCLAHALDQGLAKPDDHVLLLGTAAGISAGAMVIRL
ncbi:MAG: hypothetical protein KDE15_03380 [Erythrobacter sp.]|nr:hypothetical protein [Erythrobacter sp.]